MFLRGKLLSTLSNFHSPCQKYAHVHIWTYVFKHIRNSRLISFLKIKLNPISNSHPFRLAGYLILPIKAYLSSSYTRTLGIFGLCCHSHFSPQLPSKKCHIFRTLKEINIAKSHSTRIFSSLSLPLFTSQQPLDFPNSPFTQLRFHDSSF